MRKIIKISKLNELVKVKKLLAEFLPAFFGLQLEFLSLKMYFYGFLSFGFIFRLLKNARKIIIPNDIFFSVITNETNYS